MYIKTEYKNQQIPESCYSTGTNRSTLSQNQWSILKTGRTNSFENQILQKYRSCKPNANTSLSTPKDTSNNLLPDLFCKIFDFDKKVEKQVTKQKKKSVQNQGLIYTHCKCDRSEDNYCKLVLRWVDEEYYWKTDRQFFQVYQHYNRKNSHEDLPQIQEKLRQKLNILGTEINLEHLNKLAIILSNYLKHLRYYNKFENLAATSDVYIWAALGIFYHIDFDTPQFSQEFMFWALDIVMSKFGSLTEPQLDRQTQIAMGHIKYYYPQWHEFLMKMLNSSTNLNKIVKQWVSEMMFGYMGIEYIGFYLNSFMKIGWPYLYKIILSYFQMRVSRIKCSESFINGEITNQLLVAKLIDSHEDWPLVFCSASAYTKV